MGALIIGGNEVQEMGDKFVNYRQNGWNATLPYCVPPGTHCGPNGTAYGTPPANPGTNRFSTRRPLRSYGSPVNGEPPKRIPPSEVARYIRKFVIHHDGVNNSAVCWNVLQNERGLSCHFLIDNDGTIYQTVDLAYMAYHAAKYNFDSIGVEICSRGDAKKFPGFYDNHPEYGKVGRKREIEPCKINGHTILSYKFDERQEEAMTFLADVLRRHLPNLPLEFPRDPASPSKAYWGTMGPIDAKSDSIPAVEFAGYIAHYHLTTQKWDPGPFDFKKFIDKLRGQRSFPVRSGDAPPCGEAPLVPTDPDPAKASAKIVEAVQKYLDLNETEAHGGFFPVGPWGTTRLWHGGMHLPATENCSVHAPFPGRVVAARMGRQTDVGSANFVLLRHDLNIGSQPMRFWSLYMHLADEPAGADVPVPDWVASTTKTTLDDAVGVYGYDEPVLAGALIGHVGSAGPIEISQSQIHFEIFSRKLLFSGDPDWESVDGARGGRFCAAEKVLALIDKDQDERLSREELTAFYENGVVSDDLRRMITFHVSEWTDDPPWKESLEESLRDFTKKSGKKVRPTDGDDEDLDIGAMVDSQLVPFIWWTSKVAAGLGLPPDGMVHHYHPMRFIEKVNLTLLDTGKSAAVDADAAVSTATLNVSDDSESAKMFEAEVVTELDDQHLRIDDLVDGWEGDKPAPGKGTP